MDTSKVIVNNEVFARQTKEHIRSKLEPLLNEWEEVKVHPDVTKEFIIDWVDNLIWDIKDSIK